MVIARAGWGIVGATRSVVVLGRRRTLSDLRVSYEAFGVISMMLALEVSAYFY
jgi:hypothetical protein